jgi:hypothetical protein
MALDAEFGEVLCWSGWWDVPRFGVALIDGQPYYFDCPFSEELDDYPHEFLLWPTRQDQLIDELASWECWASWRRQYDLGQDPGEFVDTSGALARTQEVRQDGAPSDAIRAIPEWRIDIDRSFAKQIPRHFVRWRPVE